MAFWPDCSDEVLRYHIAHQTPPNKDGDGLTWLKVSVQCLIEGDITIVEDMLKYYLNRADEDDTGIVLGVTL